MRSFAALFHSPPHPLTLILVIPPALEGDGLPRFDGSDFKALKDDIDRFSLMTYDYSSNKGAAGPNAPFRWVIACLRALLGDGRSANAQKILTGLNLYGLDYSPTGAKHVLGHDFVSLLRKRKPKFVWNNEFQEHEGTYKENSVTHTVWYPSLNVRH
jgi:chitinase domain-containing protein 1